MRCVEIQHVRYLLRVALQKKVKHLSFTHLTTYYYLRLAGFEGSAACRRGDIEWVTLGKDCHDAEGHEQKDCLHAFFFSIKGVVVGGAFCKENPTSCRKPACFYR